MSKRNVRRAITTFWEVFVTEEGHLRATAAFLGDFAALEVQNEGDGSVLRVLHHRGGHSIENQKIKRTFSYHFEVGESSSILLIIKNLDSTATQRKAWRGGSEVTGGGATEIGGNGLGGKEGLYVRLVQPQFWNYFIIPEFSEKRIYL